MGKTASAGTAGIRDSLVRTTAFLGSAAALSRILGLARDMAMAWLLGGAAADALALAMRLPHVLRRLLAEGSLSMTLTAALVQSASPQASARQAVARARGLRDAVARRLVPPLLLLTLAGMYFVRPLAEALTWGQADAGLVRESASLLRYCLPYALFAVLSALHIAFLHSLQRFLLPAFLPALFNIVLLGFAAAAACGLGDPATLLACGMGCGGMLQWLVLASATHRLSRPCPAIAPPSGLPARCLSRLPAGILGAGTPQIAMLCAMMVASLLPRGAVAALYYAEHLMELPMGLAGAALGIAGLPALAALEQRQDYAALAEELGASLRLSLLVMLPAAAGLVAVAQPLVQVLFGHGAFDAAAVRMAALALCGYAPGLVAYGMARPLLAVCNARRLMRPLALASCTAICVTLSGAFLLLSVLPAQFGLLGPSLGVSLGILAQVLLLWRAIRRSLRQEALVVSFPGRALGRQLPGAVLAGSAAWLLTQLVPDSFWGLLIAVAAGIVTYPAVLLALGDRDCRQLLRCGKNAVAAGWRKRT